MLIVQKITQKGQPYLTTVFDFPFKRECILDSTVLLIIKRWTYVGLQKREKERLSVVKKRTMENGKCFLFPKKKITTIVNNLPLESVFLFS
jgi:hypothetical protein